MVYPVRRGEKMRKIKLKRFMKKQEVLMQDYLRDIAYRQIKKMSDAEEGLINDLVMTK